MKYMLLIYSDPAIEPVYGTEAFNGYIEEYRVFHAEVEEAGVFVSGEALQPVVDARTVQAHDGKVTTMDGPFAETKETLGGFYILDCKDRAQAEHFAAKIPTAKFGSVEVRPVMFIE